MKTLLFILLSLSSIGLTIGFAQRVIRRRDVERRQIGRASRVDLLRDERQRQPQGRAAVGRRRRAATRQQRDRYETSLRQTSSRSGPEMKPLALNRSRRPSSS